MNEGDIGFKCANCIWSTILDVSSYKGIVIVEINRKKTTMITIFYVPFSNIMVVFGLTILDLTAR